MQSWNHIIHAALLGTDKQALVKEQLEPEIAEQLDLLSHPSTDKEERFLQTAALVYNYRQSGFLPGKKEIAIFPQTGPETQPYASAAAQAVLQQILETGSNALLDFWLAQARSAQQIVYPEMLPVLLQAAGKDKERQALVKSCTGQRGAWLIQFNPDWNWHQDKETETFWETGTLPQRKQFLLELRKTEPRAARELLQETWPREPAGSRAELLQALQINAGADDRPWVEELKHDKSVKVKETALAILKTIPSSGVVQAYWNILKSSIRLVTSRGLLGFGSKTFLEISLVAPHPAIFSTGISQVSNTKGLSDEQFILQQLVAAVPPGFWQEQFGMGPTELVSFFSKDDLGKALIPSVRAAALHFNNVAWMRALITADPTELHPAAFTVLPQAEAEAYALRFLHKTAEAQQITQHLEAFSAEWGHEFSIALLPVLSRFPYQFSRAFFSENVDRLPVSVLSFLDSIQNSDAYQQQLWTNIRDHLQQLLRLKQQTITAFND